MRKIIGFITLPCLFVALLAGCSGSTPGLSLTSTTQSFTPVPPIATQKPAATSTQAPTSTLVSAYIEEKGIVYATVDDVDLELDLYRPVEGDGPFPAIVFMFGGGWFEGGRAAFSAQSRWAAERGYVAAAIDYRLTAEADEDGQPKYPFPAQLYDAKCAVRWLRSNAERLGIDPDRIGAAGYSAGGHLALMLALTDPSDGLEGDCGDLSYSSRVQAAVSLAGPMDLAYGYDAVPESRMVVKRLLGGEPEERPDQYRLASPISHVSEDDPPVLTLVGELDSVMPEVGELFDIRMREVGASHTLIIIEGEGHSYFGWAVSDLYNAVFEFFDRHLKHEN